MKNQTIATIVGQPSRHQGKFTATNMGHILQHIAMGYMAEWRIVL